MFNKNNNNATRSIIFLFLQSFCFVTQDRENSIFYTFYGFYETIKYYQLFADYISHAVICYRGRFNGLMKKQFIEEEILAESALGAY